MISIKKKYPNLNKGMIVVRISKKFFRPNEVENLIGDPSKAKKILNWKTKISIDQLIKEMMDVDLIEAKKLQKNNYFD